MWSKALHHRHCGFTAAALRCAPSAVASDESARAAAQHGAPLMSHTRNGQTQCWATRRCTTAPQHTAGSSPLSGGSSRIAAALSWLAMARASGESVSGASHCPRNGCEMRQQALHLDACDCSSCLVGSGSSSCCGTDSHRFASAAHGRHCKFRTLRFGYALVAALMLLPTLRGRSSGQHWSISICVAVRPSIGQGSASVVRCCGFRATGLRVQLSELIGLAVTSRFYRPPTASSIPPSPHRHPSAPLSLPSHFRPSRHVESQPG